MEIGMCCRPEPDRVLGGGFAGDVAKPVDATCKCDGCPGVNADPDAVERAAVWAAVAAELEHGLLVVRNWVRSLVEDAPLTVKGDALGDPPADVQQAFDLLDRSADSLAVGSAGGV